MIWWARFVVFVPVGISAVFLTAMVVSDIVEWAVPKIMERNR